MKRTTCGGCIGRWSSKDAAVQSLPKPPSVDEIIRYELGMMERDETIIFFQRLIDSGLAWQLQGSYGRTAAALIEDGLCLRAADRRLP